MISRLKAYLHRLTRLDKTSYAFIGVILLALVLRLYNIPGRFNLDGDALRDGLVAIGGARQFQLPLTGPFSSTGPFTFGPWYYYQLILTYAIFRSPFSLWISMEIISLAFVVIMYKIGEEIENKIFGLLLAMMAAVSSTQLAIATTLSNINVVSFLSALTLWISIKLVKRTLSLWWSFTLGIILGIGINYHYQMAGLCILPLLIFLYKVYKKEHYSIPTLVTIAGFILPCIPLLLFNLTNHWETVRGIFVTALYLKNSIYVANSWSIYLRNFWPELWGAALGIPKIMGAALAVSSLIIFAVALYKKKVSWIYLFIFITFFCNFLLLRYYWGERHVVYFSYFHPFILLFTGYIFFFLLQLRYTRYVSLGFFFFLIFISLYNDRSYFASTTTNVDYSHQATVLMSTFPNKKLIFYRCKKSRDDHRARASAFLLSSSSQSGQGAVKIGFVNDKCVYPLPSVDSQTLAQMKNWQEIYYPKIANIENVANFSAASDSALKNADWDSLTPESFYNDEARWWFTEQP